MWTKIIVLIAITYQTFAYFIFWFKNLCHKQCKRNWIQRNWTYIKSYSYLKPYVLEYRWTFETPKAPTVTLLRCCYYLTVAQIFVQKLLQRIRMTVGPKHNTGVKWNIWTNKPQPYLCNFQQELIYPLVQVKLFVLTVFWLCVWVTELCLLMQFFPFSFLFFMWINMVGLVTYCRRCHMYMPVHSNNLVLCCHYSSKMHTLLSLELEFITHHW